MSDTVDQRRITAVWIFRRIREAIRDRSAAGEGIEALADDYELDPETVRKVVSSVAPREKE